ncbi:hypothetical protein LCGC14_1184180 [marine sediment metagenome]|uniref:Uncharacterized protein n=1 Tax=marine sediment metagenome TaxID=412755 RepID=A0A0F9LR40_9ZZZZ
MLKVISTSKNGLSRQVVHLLSLGGLRTRTKLEDVSRHKKPRQHSTTRHQWKVGGKWQEIDFYFVKD